MNHRSGVQAEAENEEKLMLQLMEEYSTFTHPASVDGYERPRKSAEGSASAGNIVVRPF